MILPSFGSWILILLVTLVVNTLVIAAAIWLQREPHEEEHLPMGEFWMLAGMAAGGLTIITPCFWIPAAFGLSGVFGFILAASVVFPAGCIWLMWVYSLDDFSEAALLMMLYLGIPILLALGLAFLF